MGQWILTEPIGDQSQPSAAIPLLLERVADLPSHVVAPDPDACDFTLFENSMR